MSQNTIEALTAERDGLQAQLAAAQAEVGRLKSELSTTDVLLEECKMDWSGDVTQIKAEHKHEIDAIKADRDALQAQLAAAQGQSPLLKKALDALEVAQDNLRPHGDNCFLHDSGEYASCFCGKDSLSSYLQSVVEELAIAQDAAPIPQQVAQQAQPERAPLTQTQVVEAFCELKHNTQYVSVFDAGVRYAEKHHGIKQGGQQ